MAFFSGIVSNTSFIFTVFHTVWLRKTLMEGTPPTGPGPTSGQLALILQPNPSILFESVSYSVHDDA